MHQFNDPKQHCFKNHTEWVFQLLNCWFWGKTDFAVHWQHICGVHSPVPPACGQQLEWELDLQADVSLSLSLPLSFSLSHTHTWSEDTLVCPSRAYFLSFILNNLNEAEGSCSFPHADIKRSRDPCNELLSSVSVIMIKCPLLHYSFIQQIVVSAY